MTREEIDALALSIGQAISKNSQVFQKEILTLDEAALYTGFKRSYLYKLTANREIPFYKPMGKHCFFKREELDEWLLSNRVASSTELDEKAMTYCMKNKLK